VKLLRVLQEREFERVGGTERLPLDVRLITATHRDLKEAVRHGRMREDFYYRIHVLHIHLPPLRERREDILFFARYFLEFFSAELGRKAPSLSPTAETALTAHDFPGNIRELRNMVERAVALAERDVLGAEDFFPDQPKAVRPLGNLKAAAAVAEKDRIRQALIQADYCMTRAATSLGVSRKTLWEKIRRYSIEVRAGTRKLS
jgi:DNA-binding NtrC family response regulator